MVISQDILRNAIDLRYTIHAVESEFAARMSRGDFTAVIGGSPRTEAAI